MRSPKKLQLELLLREAYKPELANEHRWFDER